MPDDVPASDAASSAAKAKRRVLVIGYGSPIRGDDAIGAMVADQLMDELSSDQVTIHSRHILTAELASDVQSASLVIFLDASMDGELGQVQCRRLEPRSPKHVVLAHDLDPRELLAWSESLYQHVPEAYLISVRAVETDFGQYQLSPTVQSALSRMKDRVRELIEEHLRFPRRNG